MTNPPIHTYETVAGTPPTDLLEHEPRTVEHHVDGQHVSMMTEIADGTFVNWTTCDRCRKQVATCTCLGGPVEPAHIAKWRGNRWVASFDARPDLNLKVIDSLIAQLRARDYVVRKPGEKAKPKDDAPDYTTPGEARELAEWDAALAEPADPQEVAAETEEIADETWDRATDAVEAAEALEPQPDVAEVTEDDTDFARETLGETATEDEVQDLAGARADVALKERPDIDVGF